MKDAERKVGDSGAARGKPVARLEAEHIVDRDAIEMRADFPGGKNFRVDELINRLPTELPAAA